MARRPKGCFAAFRWRGQKARATALVASIGVFATVAHAQDFITTTGILSDTDFYRLVACGAAPSGPCSKPILRWSTDRPLRVSLVKVDRAFLGGKQKRARAAIARAVQYLNAASFGLRLAVGSPGTAGEINVYLINTDGSSPISGTGVDGLDGSTVTGARVLVWADPATGYIDRASVIFGTRMPMRQYESAMLEEITQALGLLTDIRNPHYDGVSVFSQDSNAAKTLGPQDIMSLRRHYAKGD